MTEIARVHKRKLILLLIIAVLFVGFKISKNKVNTPKEAEKETNEIVEIIEKKASTVSYGDWAPTEFRQVLGQVISDSNVEVKSELNGTIARVNVGVGDKVYAGQALAGFKTSGDPTAINYQSALSSLETTKLSNQNSIRSSEIALQNAQKSLEQTIAQQDQTYAQAYESLRVEAASADTIISNSLDKLDQYVQVTNKYRYNQSLAYVQVGNSNVVGKQNVKNQAQVITQKFLALSPMITSQDTRSILLGANSRLQLLRDTQAALTQLGGLVRTTAINTRISEAEVQNFIAEIDSFVATVDGKIATLNAQIESAKGVREQNRSSVLNAQNAVESAQQNLELAKSQANASLTGAQNQVNIAGASTADLTVRAPISGTVTAKTVRVGDLVNPGTALFTIVNEAQDKKVQAFLTQDELRQAQTASEITIEVDGQDIVASKVFLSSQLQAQTQKVLAEFTIPAGTTLVGNLATVKIPLGSGTEDGSNLLPFSAVSFEPDGAEVLVLDDEGIARRQKVVVDRVVVSNIEIISGLEAGEKVVEYYKRVLPGEKVMLPNKLPETKEALTSDAILDESVETELNLES